jgi:opacity protein-like surface antigen
MKRFSLALAVAMLIALAGVAPAVAASVEPHPLEWATGDTIDWAKGGLLLLFGAAGALFTIFTLVGGVVPGTAGQAQIEEDTAMLSKWTQKLATLIEGEKVKEIDATQVAVQNLRRDVGRERWRQFLLASVLYLLLGAFFAAVLADDLLQAAAIGAGWTAVAGSLGLKSDYSKRKQTKDEVIAGYQEHVDKLKVKADAAPDPGKLDAADIPPPKPLEQASEVALAL